MNLDSHGHYKLEQRNRILLIDAIGPFNEEIVEKFQKEVKSWEDALSQSPWGSLVIYRGNSIFTPDAEELLINATKARMEKGMIANASVILESTHADLQQMQLRRVYAACQLPFFVFSDINTAESWLTEFIEQQRTAI